MIVKKKTINKEQQENTLITTMGVEISSNRDQADALDMYRDWNMKQSMELLKKYKSNDYGKYICIRYKTFITYTNN